ncbi:MAG: MTH938/NDUFAF3 family protein [Pseudomonadota bacterium]
MRLTPAHYPGRAPIDAYGNGGFRFAEMSHKGHLLALLSGIHGWELNDPQALRAEDFRILLDLEPHPEILLVGTGIRLVPQVPTVLSALREVGISVDVMDTGAAARTYNILLSEERSVGAALIAV